MKRIFASVLAAAMALSLGFRAAAAESGSENKIVFYVSPDGSDSAAGTEKKPFQSLARAAKAVAETEKKQNITVYLRGGEYKITEPVSLNSANGGAGNVSVTYASYPGETAILDGGTNISGWEEQSGGIWRAKVLPNMHFRNLYINGKKAIRARFPNEGSFLTLPGDPDGDEIIIEKNAQLADFQKSDPPELCVLVEWMEKKLRIAEYSESEALASVKLFGEEQTALSNAPQGAKISKGRAYWLENSLDWLDSGGEWYLDRAEGYVYYMPHSYENMNEVRAEAGGAETLLKIEGTDASPVKNVTIENISFINTGWTRPDEFGFVDIQGNSIVPENMELAKDSQYRHSLKKDKMPGALHVLYADNITVKGCTFENLAAGGAVFEAGGSDINITRNNFSEIGGNAIEIGGDYYRARKTSMYHKNVTVADNFIEKAASDYYGGVGILAYYVTKLTIEHNYLRDLPYSGISAGWGWAADEAVPEASDYTIRCNKIENFMTQLRDGGGIYVTNPIKGNNIIENNYIIGNSNCFLPTSGTIAVYHDGASDNWTTTGNVCEMFKDPLALQSLVSQAATNITVRSNFSCPSPMRYGDTAENAGKYNLKISSNKTLKSPDWSGEALKTVQNAGLTDKSREPKREISLKSFYAEVSAGAEGAVTVLSDCAEDEILTYSADAPKEIEFTDIDSAKTQGGSRYTVLRYRVSEDAEPGYYVFNIYAKNRKGEAEPLRMGINISESGTTYVNVTDEGYSESGSFTSSTLNGFSTGTRYGYSVGASAMWRADVPADGSYLVRIYRVAHPASDSSAKIDVAYDGGVQTFTVDFTKEPGEWETLGVFPFKADGSGYVKNTRSAESGDSGFIRTSAVSFTYVPPDDEKEAYRLSRGIEQVGNSAVFREGKAYWFNNGIRQSSDKAFASDESDIFVPAKTAAAALGAVYIGGSEECIVKGARGIRLGGGTAFFNGVEKNGAVKCAADGSLLVSLRNAAEYFGYEFFGEGGLFIASEGRKFSPDADRYELEAARGAFVY